MVQLNPLFISKRFEVLDFDVVQYAHGRSSILPSLGRRRMTTIRQTNSRKPRPVNLDERASASANRQLSNGLSQFERTNGCQRALPSNRRDPGPRCLLRPEGISDDAATRHSGLNRASAIPFRRHQFQKLSNLTPTHVISRAGCQERPSRRVPNNLSVDGMRETLIQLARRQRALLSDECGRRTVAVPDDGQIASEPAAWILSKPSRINYFTSVSTPSNTLYLTRGAKLAPRTDLIIHIPDEYFISFHPIHLPPNPPPAAPRSLDIVCHTPIRGPFPGSTGENGQPERWFRLKTANPFRFNKSSPFFRN
jgi:hypothetical protein